MIVVIDSAIDSDDANDGMAMAMNGWTINFKWMWMVMNMKMLVTFTIIK